jgi:streptomycin 6-kinase
VTNLIRMRMRWAQDRFLDKSYEPYRNLLQLAQDEIHLLLSTRFRSVPIHGDLQAKNILLGRGGLYMAIDPIMSAGDVNCEAALWAVNQSHEIPLAVTLEWLAASDLFDSDRLRSWSLVFAVMELRLYLPLVATRSLAFIEAYTGNSLRTAK